MLFEYLLFLAHSPPSGAEVQSAWSYTSTPQYAFMAWCSVKKAQRQLHCCCFLFIQVCSLLWFL